MSEFAYVDPLDISDISLLDFPSGQRAPIKLVTGNFVYLPKAPDGTTLLETPIVAWDVYNLERSVSPPPGPLEYYTQLNSLAFRNAADSGDGTVGDPTSKVVDSQTWDQITIDDLLTVKRGELTTFADSVFYSAMQLIGAGGTAFWVNMSARSRQYRTDVDAYYQWTPPPPWRNIPVWLVRVSNLNNIRSKVDEAEWIELKEAQGRFSIDVGYASDEVEAELELLHGQDNWQGLADVDVSVDPPGNPWPVHNTEVFNGAGF